MKLDGGLAMVQGRVSVVRFCLISNAFVLGRNDNKGLLILNQSTDFCEREFSLSGKGLA